jgi:hypothetical protein
VKFKLHVLPDGKNVDSKLDCVRFRKTASGLVENLRMRVDKLARTAKSRPPHLKTMSQLGCTGSLKEIEFYAEEGAIAIRRGGTLL